MHSPVWIEALTLRLPDDTAPVELNAHPPDLHDLTHETRAFFSSYILFGIQHVIWQEQILYVSSYPMVVCGSLTLRCS